MTQGAPHTEAAEMNQAARRELFRILVAGGEQRRAVACSCRLTSDIVELLDCIGYPDANPIHVAGVVRDELRRVAGMDSPAGRFAAACRREHQKIV